MIKLLLVEDDYFASRSLDVFYARDGQSRAYA